ncbi:MAG: hypothetical protein WKF30_17910 [Pyrinomonadaceae bacterium]
MVANYANNVEFNRLQRSALIVGIVALVIGAAIGVVFGVMPVLFRSYLVGYVFWVGMTLGCLAILLLQHLISGSWGLVIRRLLEAGSRTLLPMAVLFVPIVLGMHDLYIWTHHDLPAENHALIHAVHAKEPYLNIPFFVIRTGIYFLIWFALAYFLNKWSLEQDRTGAARWSDKMNKLSGPGMVIFILAVTFASVDWVMSLNPEWFSTIFGLLVLIGWALSALAFIIATVVILSKYEPLSRVIKPAHLHDLGKLMLAFVMVWAYFSFSQFLIIWSGNLPEETPWYLRRMQGTWGFIGLALVVLHFALPFLLLLSRDLKRNARTIGIVAVGILVMRLVDAVWLIAPSFHYTEEHFSPVANVLYLVIPVGLGGLWVALFAWQLKKRPLVPFNDPKFEKAIEQGHHH